MLNLDYISRIRIHLRNMSFIVIVSATLTSLFVIFLEFADGNVQLLACLGYYPGDGCFSGTSRCIYIAFHGPFVCCLNRVVI